MRAEPDNKQRGCVPDHDGNSAEYDYGSPSAKRDYVNNAWNFPEASEEDEQDKDQAADIPYEDEEQPIDVVRRNMCCSP